MNETIGCGSKKANTVFEVDIEIAIKVKQQLY